MKANIVLFILLFSLLNSAYSQNSGVFLTAEDFTAEKLTYEINCSTEKHKIKLNEFLGKDYITVVHNKQSYNLKKKEVWGYKDCDNVIYRLDIEKHYKVLNPSEKIILYVIEVLPSKNQIGYTDYFFSNSVSGEVKVLTVANLKNEFPENHKFHDALDAEFGSGNNLAFYDSFHKMYKVNRLYMNSLVN